MPCSALFSSAASDRSTGAGARSQESVNAVAEDVDHSVDLVSDSDKLYRQDLAKIRQGQLPF